MTVSGGISRGSYQGGLNWGIVEIARRSSFDRAFRQWADAANGPNAVPSLYIAAAGGASAGNINGLLTAVEWCDSAAATVPEESLFWQAWVWTGWEQLMWNKDTVRWDEHALFDRRFFADILKPTVAAQIQPPVKFRSGCRVPVGVTTTRLRADTITVAEEIQASSQRFAIPFVVQTDAGGTLHLTQPSREALKDPTLGEILLLPNARTNGEDQDDLLLDAVFTAVEASSAFPLAFAPRTLEYSKLSDVLPGSLCRSEASNGWRCDTVRKAQFLDGGVFDNNPLGLAYGLYRCLPYDWSSAEVEESSCIAPNRPAMLVYMDPDARRLATGSQVRTDIDYGHVSGLATIPLLVQGAVQTGRQYELAVFGRTVKLFEGAKQLEMRATDRFQAIVGDHFSAFGAFLGRPFREFDFYAGIFDALYFGASKWFCRSPWVRGGVKINPTDALTSDARACVQRMISASLCDGIFRFSVVARSVMAALYEQEFHQHVVCRDDSLVLQTSSADSLSLARITVLTAVANANEQIRRIAADVKTDDPFQCKARAFIEETVCANGFRILLDSLATKNVDAALDVLAATKECKAAPLSELALKGCHADKTVRDLAADPVKAADALFAEVLTRLAKIPNPKGLERTVEAAELLFYSGRETNLKRFEPLPSSIPSPRGWGERWGLLIPFQVGVAFGGRSFIGGYRPTIYTRSGLQLVFPLEFSHAERHFKLPQPGAGYRVRGLNTFAVGHGIGWLFGTKWIQNVQATSFWSIRRQSNGDEGSSLNSSNLGWEASTVFLFNRFRFGVRGSPSADRGDFRREKTSIIVGLSDVNGLVYWAARLLK
jgi:hypothetical protein